MIQPECAFFNSFHLTLPSLLSPLTAFPFTSLAQRNTDIRISNNLFTIAFQWKLCLPLLPPSLQNTKCPHCSVLFDPYGDHFFTCHFSKTPINNNICNALITVCKTLGPIAGITISPHETLLEPTNLLPDTRLHCPGDVVLCLCPAPTNPCQTLVIDITITGNPPLPTAPLQSWPTNQPISLHQAHLQSQCAKLSGHDYSTLSASNLITSINSNDICPLPFTVNHLGGLGFFKHQFLFHPLPNESFLLHLLKTGMHWTFHTNLHSLPTKPSSNPTTNFSTKLTTNGHKLSKKLVTEIPTTLQPQNNGPLNVLP
jgi:hypothetical protein